MSGVQKNSLTHFSVAGVLFTESFAACSYLAFRLPRATIVMGIRCACEENIDHDTDDPTNTGRRVRRVRDQR